jgi:hypothetical protein
MDDKIMAAGYNRQLIFAGAGRRLHQIGDGFLAVNRI